MLSPFWLGRRLGDIYFGLFVTLILSLLFDMAALAFVPACWLDDVFPLVLLFFSFFLRRLEGRANEGTPLSLHLFYEIMTSFLPLFLSSFFCLSLRPLSSHL